MSDISVLMHKSSCAVRLKSSLSSLTLATALMPYEDMPSSEISRKYVINDCAKLTLPIPAGASMRETYGNEMSGNMNDDSVSSIFIMKLILIETFAVLMFP